MARRRMRTSATGGNMDSMLDTLTNVVGILIIVLVTVQLSTQEAASRIAAAVQPPPGPAPPRRVLQLHLVVEPAPVKPGPAQQEDQPVGHEAGRLDARPRRRSRCNSRA